jgi:chemotaxis protein histidine kinase CheA
MSIPPKYEMAFRSECDKLNCVILDSVQNLKERPNDTVQIKRLVQAADTIMGDARFLEDKILENHATMIVKEFTNVSDVRKKIDQLTCVIMSKINN